MFLRIHNIVYFAKNVPQKITNHIFFCCCSNSIPFPMHNTNKTPSNHLDVTRYLLWFFPFDSVYGCVTLNCENVLVVKNLRIALKTSTYKHVSNIILVSFTFFFAYISHLRNVVTSSLSLTRIFLKGFFSIQFKWKRTHIELVFIVWNSNQKHFVNIFFVFDAQGRHTKQKVGEKRSTNVVWERLKCGTCLNENDIENGCMIKPVAFFLTDVRNGWEKKLEMPLIRCEMITKVRTWNIE